MTESIYTHISNSDGLPLKVLRIEPDDPKDIKGIVQFVHGKNEHKGRYRDIMRFLADKGYMTVIHDNRGHGESVLAPDDRGYMYEGGYKALIDDIYEITLDAKRRADFMCTGRRLPVTLIGHSMGSMAARCYLIGHDREIDKLCVVGSPSFRFTVPGGVLLLSLMSLIEGDRTRSKLANKLIMENGYGRIDEVEGLHNAWTNTDREAVIKKNNDPMCKFVFTLNGYKNMVSLSLLTYCKAYRAKNKDLKIRFYSGSDDPCMVTKRKLKRSMWLLRLKGYKDVKGKLFKGMRHDILNEKKKERVWKEILKFIES
ncbi:MAG: alpha/beta fold hydrolase [Ruminococcus sp.]|nr:alpha/beta fold hydrolase [Ruminococcus sp.]